MSVDRKDCKVIREDSNTDGGVTYYVILPGATDARALCFRQKRRGGGLRCTNPAGFKTWHVKTGACYLHGGGVKEGNGAIKTGVYSKMKSRLAVRVDEYMKKDRAQLLDLSQELATTRAIMDEFLENYPDTDADDYGIWFHRFTTLIGTLGSLVEKISRIDSRNTLTAAQVLYLRATVADIMMKYLTDPDIRDRAAKELASRLGGNIEKDIDLQPSEYLLPGGMR